MQAIGVDTPYLVNDQVAISYLVRDVISRLPVVQFRDYVEYQSVIRKLINRLWPGWTSQIKNSESILRCVTKIVFKEASIKIDH